MSSDNTELYSSKHETQFFKDNRDEEKRKREMVNQ